MSRVFITSILMFYLAFPVGSTATSREEYESLKQADTIVDTQYYNHKALAIYLDDYQEMTQIVSPALIQVLNQKGQKVSKDALLLYTVTYLGAIPPPTTTPEDACIDFKVLPPGLGKTTDMYLCVQSSKNTLKNFFDARPKAEESVLKNLFPNVELTAKQKEKLDVYRKRIRYFGLKPRPAQADEICTSFTSPLREGEPSRTYYICVEQLQS